MAISARGLALRLALLCLGVLLACALAEIALRVFDYPPSRTAGWNTRAAREERNELGFRGHRISYADGDFVVVLLGDSQVESRACTYDMMPERRLEHHLGELGRHVRVVSVGAGGYGQDQQLLSLQDYFSRFRANMVIVWQTTTNDVTDNTYRVTTGWHPKPTFWLEQGELRGPTEPRRAMVRRAGKLKELADLAFRTYHYGKNEKRAFLNIPDDTWEDRLPASYTPQNRADASSRGFWGSIVRPILRLAGFRRALEIEKTHYGISLDPPSDRMTYGIRLTNLLLGEIQKLSARHGASFFITGTFDLESTKDSVKSFPVSTGLIRVSEATKRRAIGEINRGFTYLYMPIDQEDPAMVVGPRDWHLNQNSVDLAMRSLAEQLKDRIPSGTDRRPDAK